MRLWRRHEDRIAETKQAIAKQERLSEYIDMQQREARELGDWARARLKSNHLSQLFEGIVHEGRR